MAETDKMTGVCQLAGLLLRWLLLAAALTGAAVLLHGCHGDEDNELFAPVRVVKALYGCK